MENVVGYKTSLEFEVPVLGAGSPSSLTFSLVPGCPVSLVPAGQQPRISVANIQSWTPRNLSRRSTSTPSLSGSLKVGPVSGAAPVSGSPDGGRPPPRAFSTLYNVWNGLGPAFCGAVRGSRPGKQVQLAEHEIRFLCTKSRDIFISQPILLELEAPIKICGASPLLSSAPTTQLTRAFLGPGDIHGQYYDLLRLFEYGGFPPEANYLFLGDYVDRGKQSLETICLLLAYKIKYPENFFILRGNHECASINRIYGFYDECGLSMSKVD